MKTNKVPVKSITFLYKEGKETLSGLMPLVTRTYSTANDMMRIWANDAPKDGSCDKTDFVVLWEDGSEYSGTYPLMHPESTQQPVDLAEHVRSNLAFNAGQDRPTHISAEEYEAYIKQHPDAQRDALSALERWSFED